jgi:polar amino acid transport system ATP-binding protein
MSAALPVIDVGDLMAVALHRAEVARRIGEACRAHGFFYVVGHGIAPELLARLDDVSRRFFALDEPTKLQWRMALAGRAWRGYFPLGGELTSGRPDWKEGLYLGTELPDEHPLVRAGTPVHGRNLFPDVPGLRETVLDYMAAVTHLGHRLMEALAASLGLAPDYFATRYTADPLILFRLFNYLSVLLLRALRASTWSRAQILPESCWRQTTQCSLPTSTWTAARTISCELRARSRWCPWMTT